MTLFTKIFGDPNAKVVAELRPIVDEINALEPEMKKLSDAELKAKTGEFKTRYKDGETLDELLPEAFAVVREASFRVTGMRHFDVQMIGGIVLHRGQITEMKTGEGKTLVATLPLYLNAIAGKGAHLVTVNDYLAKLQGIQMGQIYDFLGLSLGIIQNLLVSYKYTPVSSIAGETPKDTSKMTPEEKALEEASMAYKVEYEHLEKCSRQEAYACDITYGTNNEYGFDYLRDNMVVELEQMSQRGHFFAVVDEVDSILIDEARTPLIISAPAEKANDMYFKFASLVERLKETEDYNIDEKMRAATLTDVGVEHMQEWLGIDNIYAEGGMMTVHHVEQALRAKAIFKRDRDYVVENNEVIIVDEFTGRKMPGRRYSEGLHQAIEAKEGVAVQRESQTMATVTFQNYFRMYEKLSGMTGTAVTEAEEFGKIYKLEVVVIPTNRVNKRTDNPDRIYKTENAKYTAIAKTVRELQAKGQPVLIGTISVEKNEALSLYLEQGGIKHEVLNAKNHEREGEIIAQAGRPGAVTLATNMAGRGVDIILGGQPANPAEAAKAKEAGGLFVIGTERHESRRIDNQLRGRSARQGDPGATQFYLSTDDDLMRIFAGERIKRVMTTLRVPDDMPIEQRSITRLIESAQKKVEGFHFDSRKHLLEYDDIINRHREVIYGKRKQILERFRAEMTAADSTALTADLSKDRKSSESSADTDTGATLRDMILDYVEAEIEQVVSFHTNGEDETEWNMQEVYETMMTIFPLSNEEKNTILGFAKTNGEKLEAVEARTKLIEFLVGVARAKYDTHIVKASADKKLVLNIEKQVLIRSMDNLWVEHLVAIDYLRTGIGLQGYGQRDPLVEYKKETYRMFNELLSLIQKEVVYTIFKVPVGLQFAPSVMQAKDLILQGASDSKLGEATDSETPVKAGNKTPDGEKIGRNDPCYCGSGKKFKNCHGK